MRAETQYTCCIFFVDTMNGMIQKWGNSLALRIPKPLADQMHLAEGDSVELRVGSRGLTVRPARPSYRLSDLVRKITPANRHEETPWGRAVGREVW